jgi:pSer/pThr/pTyr-binding forkhead associated (FHA) protein
MEKLYIFLKEGDEFQFPLTEEKISVGRLSGNDIHLQDAFCSGYHAFLYAVEKGYVIRDNSSKNGTFLNGKRIAGEVELKKSDEILIGTTRIVYEKENPSKNQ